MLYMYTCTLYFVYTYTRTTMYTVHGTYKSRTSTMYAHVHDIQVPQDRSIYYVQVLLHGHVPQDRSIHVQVLSTGLYMQVLVYHVHVHT